MMEAGYGIVERSCQTESPKNLMRTVVLLYESFLCLWMALQISFIAMGMRKLTIYCIALELYGKSPKPHHSDFKSHTWVLHGILRTKLSLFQSKINGSILGQFKNGKQDSCTPSLKSSKYMENCYMQHWSSQQDMLISPTWRPCLESSIIVLLYPTPHPMTLQVILDGGRNSYNNSPSCDKCPNQPVRGHPRYPIPITKPDNHSSAPALTSIPTHYIPPHRRVYSKNPIVT